MSVIKMADLDLLGKRVLIREILMCQSRMEK